MRARDWLLVMITMGEHKRNKASRAERLEEHGERSIGYGLEQQNWHILVHEYINGAETERTESES